VHNNSEVKTLMDQEILSRGDQHSWEILDECAALAIEDLEPKFDTVIIDEMQDFQNPAWLPLIDKCLALGLKDGRWALFGDYSRQAIYTERGNTFGADELQKELHGYGAYSVRVPLTLNCRNTKRIIEMTRALTSFDWASANGLGPEGKRVQRLYYKSSEEQFEKIQTVHAKFLDEKFDPNDMVLLWDSMSGTDRFEERAYLAGLNLCDWTGDSLHQTAIQSASIQRFKGLEANAVIVCNLQGLSDFVIQQKLYVAMTRSRSRLALILPHHLKDKVDDLMSSYFGGQNYVQS
jgi:superfamily I DNA/RNA helicase